MLNNLVDTFRQALIIGFLGCCLLLSSTLAGQALTSLSLKEAYTLLEGHYPTLQNAGVLEQIYRKELEQIDISRLPTISLNAEARLQSESVSLETDANLPFEINQPLVSIKPYVEAQYLVLDGGMTDAQKKLKATQLKAEQQRIEVDRYALRERINQLFIRVALIREQSKLFDISLRDLQARRERIAAGVEFGTLLESELIKLEVRELELKAQQENLSYQLSGTINTLAKLTGTELSDDVDLRFPNMAPARQIPILNRPEQQLFQLQREAILAQSALIEADRRPKLSAFAQAGVGYPNPLNLLDNNLAPFALIGAQFKWKVTDWKKGKLDKERLTLQALKLQNQEATFDFNLQSREAIYLAEVDRLSTQIEQDEKIAQLQAKLLNQLSAQLDEGVITSVDYITQVNTELRARQNLLIHQVELLKTQLEFWNERGGG